MIGLPNHSLGYKKNNLTREFVIIEIINTMIEIYMFSKPTIDAEMTNPIPNIYMQPVRQDNIDKYPKYKGDCVFPN